MLLDSEASQLVLVDYQIRLMPAMQDAPEVLANAGRLAQLASLLRFIPSRIRRVWVPP